MGDLKQIKIELLQQCQRNCIHCSSEAAPCAKKTLPKEIVMKILDEAKQLDVESIVFTGGEPTLYKDLTTVVKYAKTLGFKVIIYTLADPTEKTIKLFKNLETIGLDELIFSAATSLTRDKVYTYETFTAFISKLVKFLTNTKIGLHYVVTNCTIFNIEKIINFFYSLDETKTTKLSFLRYVPHGRGTNDLLLSKESLNTFTKILKSTDLSRIRLGSPWNFLGFNYCPCTAGLETIIIGFDGSAYPCDSMKYFTYFGFAGNVYTASLKEIYNSKYFEDIRKASYKCPECCNKCKNFNTCHSGCLGQKLISLATTTRYTFEQYELLAKRTMNIFSSEDLLLLNFQSGLIGEIGEFTDFVKKYLTHDVSDEKKKVILENFKKELGDILWYISAPLTTYCKVSLESIAKRNLTNVPNLNYKKTIDENTISLAARTKDPICNAMSNTLSSFEQLDKLVQGNEVSLAKCWKNLLKYGYAISDTEDVNIIIYNATLLLYEIANISNNVFNTKLNDIALYNIEKLSKRYATGFSNETATNLIHLK